MGHEISVKLHWARKLPPYFRYIPGFAHRIHLDTLGLRPLGGKGWSTDAAESFRKYVYSWEDEEPYYYGWKPPHAATIKLSDYNQYVHYDPGLKAWTAAPIKALAANKVGKVYVYCINLG